MKRKRPQSVEEKEKETPQNQFNAARQGHGSQQQHKGEGIGWLECWTCGKEQLKRDFPQNQSGRP